MDEKAMVTAGVRRAAVVVRGAMDGHSGTALARKKDDECETAAGEAKAVMLWRDILLGTEGSGRMIMKQVKAYADEHS